VWSVYTTHALFLATREVDSLLADLGHVSAWEDLEVVEEGARVQHVHVLDQESRFDG
jgi:hypothetical protein